MSEMGSCERKVTLRLLGYAPTNPPSEETKKNWARGNTWGDYLALIWVREFGESAVWREEPVSTPYGNGKIDVWLPGVPHTVEIKSTESKNRPYLPFSSHVDQLMTYLHFYECVIHKSEKRPTGELAYAFTDTNEVVSIPVEYDAERALALENWAKRVQQSVAAKMPLTMPYGMSPETAPCSYGPAMPCAYYGYCWGEDMEE